MIIKPKMRGFICTTAHPTGCQVNVEDQIAYVKSQPKIDGPKNVLVIGASTGYGIASRISAAFGSDAKTIGVYFEKPATAKKPATAGWYNSVAFEEAAKREGLYSKSINGDAFSNEMKEAVIDLIKNDLGKVDCVVYSLASPKRMKPDGTLVSSVIKPINQGFSSKTVDFHTGDISDVTIEPAVGNEVEETIQVMGGEDWELWMDALIKADVLDENVVTVAYSYIGPEVTHAVYKDGTIGRAKEHLQQTSNKLNEKLSTLNGRSFVSVNKALVTQSSSAIPVVPLYISILYKVMKEKGNHEGCIEQMYRMMNDFIYADQTIVDEEGRIRVDDWEMQDDVQSAVDDVWAQIGSDNVEELSDLQGYRDEFYQLFGFGVHDVDYEADVNQEVDSDRIITL